MKNTKLEKPPSFLDLDISTMQKMDDEISRTFCTLVFAEYKESEFIKDTVKSIKTTVPQSEAIWLRLQTMEMQDNVSEATKLFTFSLCETFGDIAQWCHTLNELYQINKKIITLDSLSEAFPFGFPSKEQRASMWDKQKGLMSNGQRGNRVDDLIIYAPL
jgi:hypothetical protein